MIPDFNQPSAVRQALSVEVTNKLQKREKCFCLSSFLGYLKRQTAEPCRQVASLGLFLLHLLSSPA